MATEKITQDELKELMQSKTEDANVDIVEKSIGVMNRWQIWICFVVFLCKLPMAWHQLNIVLIAPPTVFHCIDNVTDKCSPNCSRIVYDRSVFTETIQTQWDLVCDKSQLANFAQTIAMSGVLVGNFIFGILADKYGRRIPFIFAIILQLVASTAIAFTPWFWMFLVLRFACAVATGGTLVISFVLVMEIVGAKWRTPLCILYQIPFNLGHGTLAFIGYYLRDWHQIQLAVSLPTILLLSYYWIIPESPRWLLSTGQPEKAAKVMEKAAKFNKLPYNSIKGDVDSYMQKYSNKEPEKGKFLDLVRTSTMRIRTICVCYNWIICGLCFYGGAQYMGQLGGNMFVNIALSAFFQLPGTLCSIWFTQFFGRRLTLMCADLLLGLAFLSITVVPNDLHWLKVLFATIAMFSVSVCFCTCYIYSGELYPTVIRNIGVGTSSMCARVGSMLAPYVAGLVLYNSWLSPTIFGVIPLIGVVMAYNLPETLNCKLPETLDDNNFGKNNNKKSKSKTEDAAIKS